MIHLVIVDRSITKKKSWQIYLQKEPDLNIVGFLHDGQSVICYLEKITADIVIINNNLPLIDGIAITKIIVQRYPHIQVILITSQDSYPDLSHILQIGARGYLLNNAKIKEIIEVIRLVDQGYFHLDSNLAKKCIFKKSAKKRTVLKPKKPKIAHKSKKERFFSELKAIRSESTQIKLILRKFELRLKLLHKFSFFLLLIIAILLSIIVYL